MDEPVYREHYVKLLESSRENQNPYQKIYYEFFSSKSIKILEEIIRKCSNLSWFKP